MEVLVGKIFDLAFMPAMNGESGCPCLLRVFMAWKPGGYGFVGHI